MHCVFLIDFKTWKEELEKSTNSWFVHATGEKEALNCAKQYYYCNRSGHFKSKGAGIRHLKTQGTSKINSYCTASLTLVQEKDGECIKVYLINNIDVLKSIRSYIRSAANLTKMDKEMHTPPLLP